MFMKTKYIYLKTNEKYKCPDFSIVYWKGTKEIQDEQHVHFCL